MDRSADPSRKTFRAFDKNRKFWRRKKDPPPRNKTKLVAKKIKSESIANRTLKHDDAQNRWISGVIHNDGIAVNPVLFTVRPYTEAKSKGENDEILSTDFTYSFSGSSDPK